MIDLARYLPALLLAGGAGVAAKGGGDVSKKLIDTVKVVVSRFEMGGVAQALEIDATLGSGLPKDGDAFAAYVRENVKSRTGRDPAMDLWGQPYHLVRIGDKMTLLSFGPNMKRDQCHDQSVDEQVDEFKGAVEEEQRKGMEAAEAQAQALKAIVAAGDDLDLDDLAAQANQAVPDSNSASLSAQSAGPGGPDDVCIYLTLEARGKGGGGGDIFGGSSPYKQIPH